MKGLLTLTIITAVACIMAVTTTAFAAQETITITATVTGVQGVSLSAASWAIGSISTGASSDSNTITATNTGSATETLQMSAVIPPAGDFTLGSDAGADQIAIWGKCASVDPILTILNALTGTPGQTSANVDPASSLTVYMKYKAPTSVTGTNSDGSASVTVSTAPAL